MQTRRDVFRAIADPTRRRIIALLVERPLNLNDLAEHFEISRPAISKHVKILTECGLIIIKQKGRERYCGPYLEELNTVSDWIDQHKSFWNKKLNALDEYLSNSQ